MGDVPVANATFMFNMDDMYPEYLPDLNVLVCPVDAGMSVDDLINPVTEAFDAHVKCAGGTRGWTLTDESYVYLGHTFDKATDSDPTIPLGALRATDQACERTNAFAPTERVGTQIAAWLAYFRAGIATDPAGFVTAVDGDWDIGDEIKVGGIDFNSAASAEYIGNGNNSILRRLRNGITRFLILDNPPDEVDPRAQIESECMVMWEQAGLTRQLAVGFNHSPGGSNVLYIDGHVDFVKYSTHDKPPLNRTSILTTQCMQTER